MFNILPFGLSTAPYISTQLLKTAGQALEMKKFPFFGLLIDDCLDLGDSFEKADFASHHMRLCAAGFVFKGGKSIWVPVQKPVWLGITWDCEHGTISIKESNIDKATCIIRDIPSKPSVSAHIYRLSSVQLCRLALF